MRKWKRDNKDKRESPDTVDAYRAVMWTLGLTTEMVEEYSLDPGGPTAKEARAERRMMVTRMRK